MLTRRSCWARCLTASQISDDLRPYFADARGNRRRGAAEMTKWSTQLHYLVPEIGPGDPVRTEPDKVPL